MSRPWRTGLLGVALLVACAPAAFAQSQATTGVIEGTVVGRDGGVLPGATVTLRNTATNFEQVVDHRRRRAASAAVLLPLGPYRITVEPRRVRDPGARGHRPRRRPDDQPDARRCSSSASSRRSRSPPRRRSIETSRTEGSTRIDAEAGRGPAQQRPQLPRLHQAHPGRDHRPGARRRRAVDQRPEGDPNNISVDGADFNNPFFGEQRGGQRPPFTFNLDAVQEVVVVADGAPAEFGRSSGGFVNVITKSGTNDMHGTAHVFYKDDSLSSDADERPTAATADEGRAPSRSRTASRSAARSSATSSSTSSPPTSSAPTRPSRPTPTASSRASSTTSPRSACPDENGPIERTNDAAVALAKLDWQASRQQPRHPALHLHQLRAGQRHLRRRLLGASAPTPSRRTTPTPSAASLISTLLEQPAQRAARPVRAREPAAPLQRPEHHLDRPAAARHRLRLRQHLPLRHAVLHPGRVLRRRASSSSTTSPGCAATTRSRPASSTTTSSRRRPSSASPTAATSSARPTASSTTPRNPNYVECSNGSSSQTGVCPAGSSITGPVLLYLQQAGVGDHSVEEAGTQTIRAERAGRLPPGPVAAALEPDHRTYGLRWEAQLQPDVRTPADEVFFAPFIGRTVTRARARSSPPTATIPDDKDMWQPRLGISWDPKGDGKSVVRAHGRHLLRPHPGALDLASTRSTNGAIGQTLFRNSALTGDPRAGAGLPGAHPAVGGRRSVPARRLRLRQGLPEPRAPTPTASPTSARSSPSFACADQGQLRQDRPHHPLPQPQRPAARLPLELAASAGRRQRHRRDAGSGLRTVASTAKSRYWGVTVGLTKRLVGQPRVPGLLHLLEGQVGRRQRARPLHLPLRQDHRPRAEYSYSDRDQRHRFNAWLLWQAPVGARRQPALLLPLGAAEVDQGRRHRRRDRRPDRINPDGSVTRRNLGRKDNEFNVARPAAVARLRASATSRSADLRGLQRLRRAPTSAAPR